MGRIMTAIMFILNRKISITPIGDFPLPFPTTQRGNFNIIQKALFRQQLSSIPIHTCFIRFIPTLFSILRMTSSLYVLLSQELINSHIITRKFFSQYLARYTAYILLTNDFNFFWAKIPFFHISSISHITHTYNKKMEIFS